MTSPVGPVVIAGGGTGGHVYPALAVADALVAAGRPRELVTFVGSKRALEAEVVPAAGYRIALLPGRGIKRRMSVDNVGAVAGLAAALVRALVGMVRERPAAVLSVGGYASAPAAVAAAVLRVPLVVAESNAVPGAANRLVARAATACAVAWPGTPLPRATVTGNPVRPEIVAVERSADARRRAKAALGLPEDRALVVAFGGSLGARTINGAVADLVRRWRSRADLSVLHVVGRRDWDVPGLRGEAGGDLVYEAVAYEDRMALVYEAADLVVCRSGATTSAEVAAAGAPAVLVPLPGAPGDHQTANARALVDAGAAVLVPDRECDGARLVAVVGELLADEARLASMGAAARSVAVPDAAARVAALVEAAAARKAAVTTPAP